jgi:hypothetical protein
MTTQRERFEAYAKDKGWSIERWMTTDQPYAMPAVEAAWLAWQEAERQMIERCARVCESRYMGDNTREDMEARRCASDTRALGAEDVAE